MKLTNKWFAAGLLVVVFVFASAVVGVMHWLDEPPSGAGLTGAFRDRFVESVSRSCIEHQEAAPENPSAPKPLLEQYCLCTANKTADRIREGLSDAEVRAQIKPAVRAARAICKREYQRAKAAMK
jgi:hypothetical protein